MKKQLLYAGALLTMLSLASCDDSFNDWVNPQHATPEEAANAYGINFAPSGINIDLSDANTPDSVALVTVSSSHEDVNKIVMNSITVNDLAIPYVQKGNAYYVSTAQLDSVARISLKSQKHEKRSLNVKVNSAAVLTSGAAVNVAGHFIQSETPIATPEVDAKGYFLLGDFQGYGWEPTKPLMMKDKGNGIYVADVTTTGDSNWFKFYGASGYKGAATTWEDINAYQYGCAVNGDDAAFNYLEWNNVKTPVITGPGKKRITLDTNTWTYTIAAPSDVLWMAGDANGWKQVDALISSDTENFTGFMYLNQKGFKFCTQQDWKGTNYGAGADEGLIEAGVEQNIMMTKADGYYKVDVNVATGEYQLTAINSIGIIGDAAPKGWDEDVDLTYNKETRAWEGTFELKDGSIKFRANDAWDISWGGQGSETAFDKLTTSDGKDLKVSAGKYKVSLFAWANGYGKVTLEKQ